MDVTFLWIAVWILEGVSALLTPQLTVPATADVRKPFLIQCNYSPKNSGTPQTINQHPTDPNEEMSELNKDTTELQNKYVEGESHKIIDRLRKKREYSPKNLGTHGTNNLNLAEPNEEIAERSKDPTEIHLEVIEGESPMIIDKLRRKREFEQNEEIQSLERSRRKGEFEKNEAIQSLKLYAGAAEVFRYSPSPTPQYHQFPSAQAHVTVERWRCADGGCEVTVRAQPGRLTWRCDLSGEGPTFDITSSLATVDVFAEPVYPPTIVGDPGGVVSAGTVLLLNCSTDLAAPPAHVTWIVDGQQLAEDSMSDVGVGLPDEIGLRKSWRGARVVVPPGEAAVSVECVATQAPPAATTRQAVIVLQRSLQPQISKYTAASGSHAASVSVLSLWVMVMMLLLETT